MSCGNCKHWGAPEDYDRDYLWRDYQDMKPCRRIRHVGEAGVDALAAVTDASHYYGALLTRAEFGCVLGEVKP